MNTAQDLIQEWKSIRARADELHRRTGLPMYHRLVNDADQHIAALRPHIGKGTDSPAESEVRHAS